MKTALFTAILEKLFEAIDEAKYEEEVKKLEALFKGTAAFEAFKYAKAIAEQSFIDSIYLLE